MYSPKKPVNEIFITCFAFLMFENHEMPNFPHRILEMEKIGHFNVFEHKKWGISGKKHVTCFSNRKGPKLKFIDLGAFRGKMHMPSHDKFLLHMLFEVFDCTSRTSVVAVFSESIQKNLF